SCKEGVCGSCEVRVLDGEVEHFDGILSSVEKASNQVMMVCVSRAKSPRLVLDL
ncbi:2Fe-2S iron-sulfur cluster binding domain-containing protein, partial [Pseudomonas sp. S 311-6]|nr:2Fe-2S iron-sulfur cluster binding domain-containing protein [Pseudomonas sp. S 311-6]